MLLETLFERRVSHSCACICCAIVIVCASVGRSLYDVRASHGFTLNEIGWAISARVLVWKLQVLLMTIGMICSYSRPLLCCSMVCLSGS